MWRFLAGPPLLGGPKNFFHRVPNPLSATLSLCVSVWLFTPITVYSFKHRMQSLVEEYGVNLEVGSKSSVCVLLQVFINIWISL
jgi:hypothetical protein